MESSPVLITTRGRTRLSGPRPTRLSRARMAAVLGVAVLAAPLAATDGTARAAETAGSAQAATARPHVPNPYLALLPDPSMADYDGWDRVLAEAAVKRQARLRAAVDRPPLEFEELEAPGARENDEFATAELLEGLGSGRGANARSIVRGSLDRIAGEPVELPAHDEDDGAIPLARDTTVDTFGEAVRISGKIGDGVHGRSGTGSGDFDFYRVDGRAGGELRVDVDAEPGVDTMAVLWNADGEQLALSDDDGAALDPLLRFAVPDDGAYYVMVTGYPVLPSDPFDPASGDGAGAEGGYTVEISMTVDDVDLYAVDLRPGDVLAASVTGSAEHAVLYDPDGREVQGSTQDLTAIYSPASPLPGGGNAVVEHVATEHGRHYLQFDTGISGYEAIVEVHRPTAERDAAPQTLFLDFDGERINTAIFGGPGIRELSPFRAWLAGWGLGPEDEEAVARQVIATVEENVKRDLTASGLPARVRLVVKNSYDHADPFGAQNVSRVVIGGSIDESGLATIGVAENTDPGNFGHEDSALVLLDTLSGPPAFQSSLNYHLTEESDRIEFVGRAIGNIVAHEAGHFLGSWHTDPYNDVPDLMDAGASWADMFGVGPDGIGGTADDLDVDFGQDTFATGEGFTGTEHTLGRTAFGVARPRGVR